MTLYFDYTVHIEDPVATVNTVAWHTQQALLAVASFSQETGGTVTICDELGEPVKDVHPTRHTSSCPLALAWHPTRRTLISSWENGEIRMWNGEKEFGNIISPHKSPVLFVKWSQMGGRLVSIDSDGIIAGWRVDSRGQLAVVYQHDLQSPASCIEYRRTRPGPDLTNLAKRAVAGDQRALDLFSAWRPRTAGQRTTLHQDNLALYVGSRTGKVYHVSENGQLEEVLAASGRVEKMLYHERDDSMIILSDGLSLGYYSVSHDGSLSEITKVKLNGVGLGSSSSVVWAGIGIIACAVGDMTVRCWEPSTGDSYSLPVHLPDTQMMGISSKTKQTITALAYSPQKGVLCGCTNMGTILFWHSTADGWEQMSGSRVRGHIQECSWGGTNLAVNTSSVAYVLREHSLCAAYNNGLSAVQVSASQLIISSSDQSVELKTDVKVSGVCISKDNIALWSGKTVVVYQSASLTSLNVISSFSCECENVQLHEQSLIVLEMKGHVQIMTFQGTVKQTLDCDSTPIGIHLNNAHLVIYTISGVLHLWDLTRREAKPVSQPKDLMESIDDFGEVICARVNSNGTKVSVTIAGVNLLPVPNIYVWDIESNSICDHSFVAKDNSGESTRFVMNHYWDKEEPRLMVCEAKRVPPGSNISRSTPVYNRQTNYSSSNPQPLTLLISIVSSTNHGLLVQDTMQVSEDFISLLAVDTPNYIVLIKPSDKQWVTESRLLMKDFVGIDKCDNQTKSAILNFSFSLSIGDIDQAFKTIRNVKSVAVWSNLAKLCVKARRLDVAAVCLGHTKDARGVAALREAQSHPQPEAKLATLAVHLGLIDEAETLYESCGRWDLLNKLYQSKDQWDRALKLAEEKDRIHLRHTYHTYAQYLEERGDTEGAVQMYQRADTHRYQVTRMLLDDSITLESYVLKSKDPSLIKWWAQYMESSGDMELAMKFYKEAEDHLSMVRVMCFLEEFDRAAEIASSSGDKAACYHLARQYENMGLVQEAIHFFTRATAYANAIRMCKEQNLDEQLWTLALSAGTREQIEAAKHLEPTAPDKSVLLYHRSGMLRRALDLAFKCEQFDAVQLIATELDSDADEELLMKCAHFFMEKQHYEKAVSLLAVAKKYEEGIALSWEHSVPLNEELAEALTPSPGHPERSSLLQHLAECALSQANYHLATKKFTQAGNKVKAMKALLKSGDTEKIIFFATVSRQREIYVMAGNYLQSLDWQAQPELLKSIVTFYTKGRAPHLLANFYMSCAQVEIDEYGNYEKALGALNEAARCLAKDSDQFPQVAEAVARKTAHVKKFIDTRRLLERGDVEVGLQQCRQLLAMPGDLVRNGDVYSLMIEQASKVGDWKLASQLAQELHKAQPHDNLALYIPRDIMERLGLTNVTAEDETGEQEIEELVEEEEEET